MRFSNFADAQCGQGGTWQDDGGYCVGGPLDAVFQNHPSVVTPAPMTTPATQTKQSGTGWLLPVLIGAGVFIFLILPDKKRKQRG